jgi:carbon monoxide dehydrogenase subunit G
VSPIEVDATPEEVWAVLADFGGIARWVPTIDHSCVISEISEGVGAVRRIQVGRTALLERVLEWEPGVALAYAIEGLPPVLRSVENRWTIVPVGDRTRVALDTRVTAGPRPPHRLAARVATRRFGAVADQLLEGLAAEVDRRRSMTP